MKCLSKDRNNNVCRNHRIGETRFCKLHQYMNEYTDTMLEDFVFINNNYFIIYILFVTFVIYYGS
jgi:hypothetical protein